MGLDVCLLVRLWIMSWMDGMECRWCGLAGLFSFFLLEELGRGVFAVIWCGHWCCKEDGKEGFRACRLWCRMWVSLQIPWVGTSIVGMIGNFLVEAVNFD